MANTKNKVSCYISYMSKDGELYAKGVADALMDKGVDLTLGFGDKVEGNYLTIIRNYIQTADAFIFIGTPEAIHSDYTRFELEAFYSISSPRGIIIPIMFLEDEDFLVVPEIIKKLDWIVEEMSGMQEGPSQFILQHLFATLDHIHGQTLSASKFSELGGEKNSPLNEGKLILVGRGEVGKTSLVKRLVKNSFNGDESKTQGVNITAWLLRCSQDTYRLNIWDFGGQEIMHATHQFFLTERSLYLLILNGREGGEDVDADYWLKHIESFGSDSPVIVVQNKIVQHPFELNYRGLQARYPQIRGFFKTDCKDKTGIDQLRTAIQKAIEEMPETRILFPEDWFTVKMRLESMKEEYIGKEKFTQLCNEEGVKVETDQDTLRWVLHCLGIALNYRNDSRLRETSVLKPEWITQGIYTILNAAQLAECQGELHLNDLQQILPKNRYPKEKHLFILELMRKFRLCFTFPDQEDHYLIPELLGKEEPEATAEFPPSACLNYEYHYGILPEGLIPRFIVRSHILSINQRRWRTGVILAHEDCHALVMAEAVERRVIIRVKGGDANSRRNLLAIIRYDFDGINSDFKDRLDAQQKVPVIGFPEVSVDYKKLVAFEKQGITSFPEVIGQRVITLFVSELLNGVDLEKQREKSQVTIVQATNLFISYSHKDEGLKDELETHLKLLQRQRIISAWSDRKILPGSEWDHEIDNNLQAAKIILLLISPDFIASNYCWDNEVKEAIARHDAGKATVIPIMLRPCDCKGAAFEKLQGLPKNLRPITLHNDRDSAWAEVAAGIRALIDKHSPIITS